MDYQKKIIALLHDPLFKAMDIRGHESGSTEILKALGISHDKVKEEDWIASAMDRLPIPWEKSNQVRVSLEETGGFVHSLSGNRLDTLKYLQDFDKAKSEFMDNLRAIAAKNNEEKLFHALWWHLPDMMEGSAFLPADTRIPNHSIVDHLDSTSALAGTIEDGKIKASLISVSVGPVQSFIAAARKTMDLWGGSYLLSQITYKGIEYIGKNYGFDCVIFPSLRNIAFVEKSLSEWGLKFPVDSKVPKPSTRVASLPNRFVAVVPTRDVKLILKGVEEAIKAGWKEIANDALKEAKALDDRNLQRQLDTFPEVFTASQELIEPESAESIIGDLYDDSEIAEEVENLNKLSKEYGAYKPNAGALYSYAYRLLRSRADARKTLRTFTYFTDNSSANGKSLPGDQFNGDMKAIFKLKDGDKKDYLNAVNASKRLYASQKDEEFPSVDEFARRNRQEFIRFTGNKPDSYKNNYYAILLMDGDRMGKWIGGEYAPEISTVISEPLRKAITTRGISEGIKKYLLQKKTVQPAYHRTVSRTLNIFSSLVQLVVEEHGGELVYSGGDDVLAFLPAVSVLECANDIRKMYSGIGDLELDSGKNKLLFKDEMLWINGKPHAPMMGVKATMSAGIAVVNHKFPLSQALRIARDSEHYAKDGYGRDSFVVSTVRRSGQISRCGTKWATKDNNFDTIVAIKDIVRRMETLDFGSRSLRKLFGDDLILSDDEFTDKYIPYVLKKAGSMKNDDGSFEANLKDYFRRMSDLEKRIREDAERNGDPSRARTRAVDLLLVQDFLLRGDGR